MRGTQNLALGALSETASRCFHRMTECQFRRLGCPWRGPHHEATSHAVECPHPERSGRELMPALAALDAHSEAQEAQLKQLVSLLSFEKITFNG
jgi:hypothetical protein